MYTLMDNVEGMAPRFYRSPSEIQRDMEMICAKIAEVSDMISVHNLLIEMIPIWSGQAPERWIPELEDTVAEANEALDTLKELKEKLDELKCELEEVRWLIKR